MTDSPGSRALVLVPITSDGSERSSRSTAAFGDDASPSIAIAPCCEPTGLAHSPVIFSVHER